MTIGWTCSSFDICSKDIWCWHTRFNLNKFYKQFTLTIEQQQSLLGWLLDWEEEEEEDVVCLCKKSIGLIKYTIKSNERLRYNVQNTFVKWLMYKDNFQVFQSKN